MKIFLLYYLFFSLASQLYAQCPSAKMINKKIIAIKDSSLEFQLRVLKSLEEKSQKCPIKDDTIYFNLLQKIGAVYYNLDNYKWAEIYTIKSVEGYKKTFPLNGVRLVKSLLNLAMTYRMDNNHFYAFSFFDSCLYYAKKFQLHSYQIDCYKNLAFLFYYKGDYQQSVYYAERAEQVARNIRDTISEAILMGEKALYLLDMKHYDNALVAAENSLSLYFSSFEDKYEGNKAFIYAMYAEVIRLSERPTDAIEYYKNAIEMYSTLSDSDELFVCLNNIGDIYYDDLKDPNSAKKHFRKALKYARDAYDSALAYSNEGEVISLENELDDALKLYQKALMILPTKLKNTNPNYNPLFNNLRSVPRKDLIVIILIDKATTRMKQYKLSGSQHFLDKAMECYQLADTLIDNMLSEQKIPASKVLWREKTHVLYEAIIEICLIRNRITEAFNYFEKSRAYVLNEQVEVNNWLMKKDHQILFLQTKSKREIIRLEQELKKPNLKEIEKYNLQNSIFQLRRCVDSLTNLIRWKSQKINYSVVSLNEIQSRLGDHFGLLELFVGDSAVYILFVDERSAKIKKIDRFKFDHIVSAYIQFCNTPGAININFNSFVSVATNLYNLIFNGLALNVKRLIVSPDGQFIPFESLIYKNENRNVNYLISDYAISYTYSAKSLMNNTNTPQMGYNKFLGFAPVSFNKNIKLESLLKSDESLKLISDKFSSSVINTSLKATKRSFLESFNKYEVIQLYTHAAGKSQNNEPVIYFSDSSVYLSDLLVDQPVATKFIFLSGCETATGKVFKGEGVFSLGRGFAALGIPSTITTLWKVENQSMYRITELFYQHLSDGKSKDIALQKAKLDFMKTSKLNSLPYYWAAPVLIGNTDPLMTPRTDQNIWILILSIIAAALVAFIAIRRLK